MHDSRSSLRSSRILGIRAMFCKYVIVSLNSIYDPSSIFIIKKLWSIALFVRRQLPICAAKVKTRDKIKISLGSLSVILKSSQQIFKGYSIPTETPENFTLSLIPNTNNFTASKLDVVGKEKRERHISEEVLMLLQSSLEKLQYTSTCIRHYSASRSVMPFSNTMKRQPTISIIAWNIWFFKASKGRERCSD